MKCGCLGVLGHSETDQFNVCVCRQLFPRRSNLHLSAAVTPLRQCHISSQRLLSELSSRERNLRRMLQGERFRRRSEVRIKSVALQYFTSFLTRPRHLLRQSPSTRSPSWRSCSLTAAPLRPKRRAVWGSRRGNTIRLFPRATRPARLLTIRHCYSCTRSPSPLTAASVQPPATPQTTLAPLLATASSSAPRSNTWWVWGLVTTRCSCQVSIPSIRLFPLRDL